MRRTGGVALLALLGAVGAAIGGEPPTARHGTAVDWWERPGLAALAAEHQDKLLLVLEVAGDWQDPGRT